uniref:Retrovirus-related Pol polyprotein from transposon TNT 1-94 n=1 Tax=Tanacetum cinerariifolium TaxID=118510 RepID=A0A6L2KKS5_TANCI|nr:hypothetical protein [Tanacetum cinerariifolium]
MGDEHLNTILATKSDEYIKSCVENLVPNPSEFEGENGCDVLAGFTTFSNVLFDDDYDSDSSDNQSLSVKDVSEKIYSNPVFDEEIIPMEIDSHSFNAKSDLIESLPNHDSSVIISSKINSLFDEFAGELTHLKSFPPGIDKTDCHPEKEIHFAKRLLYDNSSPRPPKEIVSDISNTDIESFSPSPIPNKDNDDDSERDISILKELLDNYSLSLPTTESYHFDIPLPYRPPVKPPDGDTGTLNIKMMGDVSDQKVPIPNLTITRILNQEKSPDLLSHLGFEAFQPSVECPMIINGKNTPVSDVPLFHFYPLDQLKYGGIRTAFGYNHKRYCMDNSKRGSIPMQEKLKLSKSQGASTPAELKRMQNVPYASDVGSILYAVRCTRLDVAFAQNTGYVFVSNGGVFDWKSAKQSIFATSFAEAEYIAAFDASKEAVWVRKFISRLGVVPRIEESISMYCDNTRAIAIANE